MSIQPSEFPGRTDRTIPVISRVQPLAALQPVPDDFAARMGRQSDNRIAVEFMVGEHSLPGSLVATPELVHVTVADIRDLGLWMAARGGEVDKSPVFGGVQLHQLITFTDARSDGSRVLVRVSCAVPTAVTR